MANENTSTYKLVCVRVSGYVCRTCVRTRCCVCVWYVCVNAYMTMANENTSTCTLVCVIVSGYVCPVYAHTLVCMRVIRLCENLHDNGE